MFAACACRARGHQHTSFLVVWVCWHVGVMRHAVPAPAHPFECHPVWLDPRYGTKSNGDVHSLFVPSASCSFQCTRHWHHANNHNHTCAMKTNSWLILMVDEWYMNDTWTITWWLVATYGRPVPKTTTLSHPIYNPIPWDAPFKVLQQVSRTT